MHDKQSAPTLNSNYFKRLSSTAGKCLGRKLFEHEKAYVLTTLVTFPVCLAQVSKRIQRKIHIITFELTVRCMAGGRCGLSAEQFLSDRLRLRPDTCRRRRTITNATDAPASTVAADNAPTSRPITRCPPAPVPISLFSRFFVCCGKPENRQGKNEYDFEIFLSRHASLMITSCLFQNKSFRRPSHAVQLATRLHHIFTTKSTANSH